MAELISLLASGVFFLSGLLTGTWKYWQISHSEQGRAHYYVDIAHRTSLMYSFACLLLAHFAAGSAWSEPVNITAVIVLLTYFALSVGGYVLHGFLQDTNNQLRRPHKMGKGSVPAFAMAAFMWSLVAAEIAAFVVLFAGFISGQV